MKIHVTGLGVIDAEHAVLVQLRNMALHSADDCSRLAEDALKNDCMYSHEYWSKLSSMYMDMHDSIKEVIR